jgi:hypothetical protein
MGSIGVRCSRNPENLWFHLEVAIANDFLHPPFRTDGSDKELNTLLHNRHPWDRLTFIGSRIVIRVLALPGVKSLEARPDYFDLDVVSEESWRDILPKVVEIIRDETDDPQAKVVPKLGNDETPIPQWHAALLRELFG